MCSFAACMEFFYHRSPLGRKRGGRGKSSAGGHDIAFYVVATALKVQSLSVALQGAVDRRGVAARDPGAALSQPCM